MLRSERFVGVCMCLTLIGLVSACSDDATGDTRGPDESDTGVTTIGATTGDEESESGESGDPSTETTADTGPMCSEEQLECGVDCCEAGQVCFEDSCAEDCGGVEPCGVDNLCCAGGDVCYLGECVLPAGPCEDLRCATKPDEEVCEEGYVCDTELGECVPTQADPDCQYVPPPSEFAPRPEFTWGERKQVACVDEGECQTAELCLANVCTPTWVHLPPEDAAANVHVSSIPVVADPYADCVPEVIFNSYKSGTISSEGVVRALHGDTGQQLWAITDPAYASDSTSNPAVGDIDLDGLPEVVFQGPSQTLIAVDSDGTPLWNSDPFAGGENSGSVAIANMDGLGNPEIVFGAAIYASTGALLWEGGAGIGRDGQGPISCIADLDGDFRPELIGGNTAYKTTGTVDGGDFSGEIWWEANIGDGRCGVADFDDDGDPEVILVRGGNIYALDGQTGAVIDEINIPGSADRGGAPNIADFNADGIPEVATSGSTFYIVAEFDGLTFTELWRAPVEDDSSRVTGSSVFDFDGDGSNEVIYNDEKFIRIYPGVEPDCLLDPVGPGCDGIMSDDEVLFRDPNTSRTRTEYPVVADVDGDFKAELVFSTNSDVDWGIDAGIEVWGDALDNWVSTRPIWNQHSYHISNVGVDGSIPAVEQDSWLYPVEEPFNSYRRNAQGASNFCAPNLVLFDLEGEAESCPDLILSVDVANLGCLGVGAGVNVSFYEQDLGLLGTVQTQNQLPPGAKETVTLDAMIALEGAVIYAIVDDDGVDGGQLNECDEANEADPIVVCVPIG